MKKEGKKTQEAISMRKKTCWETCVPDVFIVACGAVSEVTGDVDRGELFATFGDVLCILPRCSASDFGEENKIRIHTGQVDVCVSGAHKCRNSSRDGRAPTAQGCLLLRSVCSYRDR